MTRADMKKADKIKTLEAHYREHRLTYVNMIARRNDNDLAFAEDAVQEGTALALKYINSFDPKRGGFGGWFRNKIFNAAYTLRSREYRGTQVDISTQENSPETLEFLQKVENKGQVEDFIDASLEEGKTREACRLHYVLGYNISEVGEALGCGRAMVHYHLKTLKDMVEEV